MTSRVIRSSPDFPFLHLPHSNLSSTPSSTGKTPWSLRSRNFSREPPLSRRSKSATRRRPKASPTFEPDQLITLLDELHVLRKLTMYSCEHCFQDELIERLTYDSSRGSETILPCLGKLTIQHAGDDFDDDLLADMIESRWNVTSPATSPGLLARLRAVDIHAGSYRHGDTTRKLGELEELQARTEVLRKEGMRVYLI
uniref:Uncharacterized protein n=1 Tax=Mycena chlorophos TaxID=658473 RepID=A0ABQ0L378_MYCCL|nr:predicted protein [Mycena chlorophos]